MFKKIYILITLIVVLSAHGAVHAQSNSKIEEQRRRVEQYKRDLESVKREVAELKKEKSTASQRISALDGQVRTRNRYIGEIEREKGLVEGEIDGINHILDSLGRELNNNRHIYSEAIRTAYRNYRHSNYNNYLFTSASLSEMAHRMARLEHIARSRQALADTIAAQSMTYDQQRTLLDMRRGELDSTTRVLEAERAALKADRAEAQQDYNQLSRKEKRAITRQREQQQRLDKAIAELSKLTRGNKVGGSFSASTSNLNLPVEGGAISKTTGATATITGSKGAAVRTIYEGLVMRVDKSDITNHYSVFIAYGEYLSVYTNLSRVNVKAGDKVKRDQTIGTIGLGVDPSGKQYAYVQFAIHDTRAGRQISVADFFKKK